MKKIFNFIVRSSKNPKAISLTVKAALLGLVPYSMHALDIVCKIGYQCISIDPSLLEQIVDVVANGVFYILSLASLIGVAWGLARKIERTVNGENNALKE